MEGADTRSTRKSGCGRREGLNDVKTIDGQKKIFSTKLSLPKFISAAKQLTPDQRMLVNSMGFHHLLDLCCESVPRGICIWLAKRFEVSSRSLVLPNGQKIAITPHSVYRVLGIPNGGKTIPKKCDDSVRKWICQETGCRGTTPTINELKDLLTPHLIGDKFKIVFSLFTLSSFLCPTSYGCASPDYYSAIASLDEIGEYDWCGAVLDKITQSVDFYQKTEATSSSTTLGGCILVLVIIYFELLDIPVSRDCEHSPSIKFWSTEMVRAFETLDAEDEERSVFGRLPLKDLSKSMFCTAPTSKSAISEENLTCAGQCTESARLESYKVEIASTFQDLERDIQNAIEPIVSICTDRVYSLWQSLQHDSNVQKKQPDPGLGDCSSAPVQPKAASSNVAEATHT